MSTCPFADQSKRYDGRFPGSYVGGFPARGVLHSTETTGLPSYQGGAVAPHFTVDPRTGRIWQHFTTARPSRSLQHVGSVQTNNANTIQIEIIAYSDAGEAKSTGGLRVDRLTPAQLTPIAKLMRWVEKDRHIRPVSGLDFESYPDSAGVGNGIRLSAAHWQKFNGWCGHSHVPQNNHGDPSDIAIKALLVQTTRSTMTATTYEASCDKAQEIGPDWSDSLQAGTAASGSAIYSICKGPGSAEGNLQVYFTGTHIRVRGVVVEARGTKWNPVASCGSQDFAGVTGQLTCVQYNVGRGLTTGQRIQIEARTLDGSKASISHLQSHVVVIEGK